MTAGNRGIYRGTDTRTVNEQRRPRILARAENTGTSQTAITTEVDITGLAVNFTVTVYPVRVRLYHPFVYGSADQGQIVMSITDGANVVKGAVGFTSAAANGLQWLVAEEIIRTPGSYTRKGRIKLNSGAGNANTFADPTFAAYIEAQEFEV
jgi:hypothetical protein